MFPRFPPEASEPETMIELLKKQKEAILYLVFGGLTTLVNIAAYFVCDEWARLGTVPSTIIAWLLSVAFAFVTNKIFVFESKGAAPKALLWETASFFGCRLFSGVLDLFLMWLTVDVFLWNNLLMKIVSNLIVIILNYVFSKFFIFRKNSGGNRHGGGVDK